MRMYLVLCIEYMPVRPPLIKVYLDYLMGKAVICTPNLLNQWRYDRPIPVVSPAFAPNSLTNGLVLSVCCSSSCAHVQSGRSSRVVMAKHLKFMPKDFDGLCLENKRYVIKN